MMRLTLLSLAAVVLSVGRASAQSTDEAEIKNIAMKQGDAWTRHDAKAYAALFTEDCDVINVVGWRWKGRDQVERKLGEAFRFMFRDSRLSITEVDTRFLHPDVAVAHARWTMTGAKVPPGMPEPRTGIQTLVLTKQSGHWLITAFQNTLSFPERPFPTGPPAGAAQQ